jgi:hypothetical protein
MSVDANNPNVGDIYIGPNGSDRLCSSLSEEVQQLLFTRFRFFLGEWFLDPTTGIPYFQSILGQKVALSIVAQVFKQVITTCPGVASLDSFSLAVDARRAAKLVFACMLADGTTLKSSDFVPFVIGTLTIGGP